MKSQHLHIDNLILLGFQGVKILSVLSFENVEDRTVRTGYYLPKVQVKDCNIMIDKTNCKTYVKLKTYVKGYENILKNNTGRGDNYPTGCLLNYPFSKKIIKMLQEI